MLWLLFYAAAAVLTFCIVAIVFAVRERKQARDQYSQMQAAYEMATPTADASGGGEPTPAPTMRPDRWYADVASFADRRINFAALTERNPEVCGWIVIEGTSIDYPVLRAKRDESYYLTHDIDGKASEHGTICIDPRNAADFSDRVTMVYGHNMLDGSMFAPLYDFYKKPAFFAEDHRVILYLDDVMLTYRVVAAYEYGHEQPLYYYDMEDDEDFLRYCDTFLQNTDLKARIRPGVTVAPSDRILTLITSTNVRADRRLFVQAVLIDAE